MSDGERRGRGEPLLLIQGMGGTRRSWGEPLLAALDGAFDLLLYDHRGVGGSPPPAEPFTIADLAADARSLLDAHGWERAHVAGVSMGGMVAQELALAEPERVRTLTLGCTYAGGPRAALPPQETLTRLGEAMASGDRERVLRANFEINLSPAFAADPAHWAPFAAMAAALPVPAKTVRLQLAAIMAHDAADRLAAITAPTLVVHGDQDALVPPSNGELIAGLIPGARLERLAGAGHMFWWEQPARTAALLREHAASA